MPLPSISFNLAKEKSIEFEQWPLEKSICPWLHHTVPIEIYTLNMGFLFCMIQFTVSDILLLHLK